MCTHRTTPLSAEVESLSKTVRRFLLLPLTAARVVIGCSAGRGGTTAAAATAAAVTISPTSATLAAAFAPSTKHTIDDEAEFESFLRPLLLRAGIVQTPFSVMCAVGRISDGPLHVLCKLAMAGPFSKLALAAAFCKLTPPATFCKPAALTAFCKLATPDVFDGSTAFAASLDDVDWADGSEAVWVVLLLLDIGCAAEECEALAAVRVAVTCGAWKALLLESESVGDSDCAPRQLEEEECLRLWVRPEKLDRREGCWKGGSGEAQREETVSGV